MYIIFSFFLSYSFYFMAFCMNLVVWFK